MIGLTSLGACQLTGWKKAGYRRVLSNCRTTDNGKLVRSGTELIIIDIEMKGQVENG